MWTETTEGRRLIQEIAKNIVVEVAPEEMGMFDDLVAEYFQDPSPPSLSSSGSDDALGFGLETTLIAATPAIAAMSSAVLGFLATEVLKAAQNESAAVIQEKIKALFNAHNDKQGPPPLTAEQLALVKTLACKQAIEFGTAPGKAEKMANALIGCLALA
jgi:hypothetical protein